MTVKTWLQFMVIATCCGSLNASAQFGHGAMMIGSAEPPSAPTSVTVSANTPGVLDISWTDTATTESGYAVERSADGSTGWSTLSTTAANATLYADSGLAENALYYYRVRGMSVDGPGPYSAVANGRVQLTKPATFTASSVSTSQINLSWSDSSSAETGYQIDRSTDNTNWTNVSTTAANATTYANTGLASATTYYYRIRAVNANTTSAYVTTNATTQVDHGTVYFSATGAWTVPNGIYSVTIQIWGGGGGGGASPWEAGGGGGGGGGSASAAISVSPGQSISFTVGGGGSPEQAGGATYCAGLAAYGGGGGTPSTGFYSPGSGGGGGGASGGSSNWGGAPGAAGNTAKYGGNGGAAGGGGGGGGAGGVPNGAENVPGTWPGGGGGGGGKWQWGASGAAGGVKIVY